MSFSAPKSLKIPARSFIQSSREIQAGFFAGVQDERFGFFVKP